MPFLSFRMVDWGRFTVFQPTGQPDNRVRFAVAPLLLALVVACHHARPVAPGPLPRAAYAHYLAGKTAL